MYVAVYAPTGEVFEVTAERAAELKLAGWTSTPVTTIPAAASPVQVFDLADDPTHDEKMPRRPKRRGSAKQT